MSDKAPFDLTAEASFRRWHEVTIRYSDQDPMGHINNTAYATYFEVARTRLLIDLQMRFPRPNLGFTLARIEIDYHKEAFFPGTVRVGGRMIAVGNKSLRTGYGMFLGDDCLATALCVNVCMDTSQRISQPLPADIRTFIAAEIGDK